MVVPPPPVRPKRQGEDEGRGVSASDEWYPRKMQELGWEEAGRVDGTWNDGESAFPGGTEEGPSTPPAWPRTAPPRVLLRIIAYYCVLALYG
jgi:hypothetical protein